MRLREYFSKRDKHGVTLDLHIGMPKTGTTAIQNFFAHNRSILRDRLRILYPDCGIPVNQHTALVKSVVTRKYDWVHFNTAIDSFDPIKYIADVLSACRQFRCRKVVMSSEFFWASPVMQAGLQYHSPSEQNFAFIESVIKDFKKLFADFAEVRIIVYLRKQDDWIDSFFNQQLKDGFSIPDFDEIAVPKNYLMYVRNIQLWAQYFGKENIVVRMFDQLKSKNIVLDFCEIIDADSRLLEFPEKDKDSANTKLSAASARIMRLAIDLDLRPEIMRLLREVLQELSFRQRVYGKIPLRTLFDDDFYNRFLSLYDDDRAELEKIFPHIIYDSKSVANPKEQEVLSDLSQNETQLEELLMYLLLIIKNISTDNI